jgi:hypothetical protein
LAQGWAQGREEGREDVKRWAQGREEEREEGREEGYLCHDKDNKGPPLHVPAIRSLLEAIFTSLLSLLTPIQEATTTTIQQSVIREGRGGEVEGCIPSLHGIASI